MTPQPPHTHAESSITVENLFRQAIETVGEQIKALDSGIAGGYFNERHFQRAVFCNQLSILNGQLALLIALQNFDRKLKDLHDGQEKIRSVFGA